MRIVLAYSGGLETSVAIPWLAEKYRAEIVTVTMDLGQGRDLEDVRDRALASGALRAHVLDLREEFARDFVLPALQAGAVYEGRYPLATALGRPLIAKQLVHLAHVEGATAIAHGSTGQGNDQVRMDVSARALDPGITIIGPAREWGLSRADEVGFARERGIPIPATMEGPYNIDVNLWGRSIAGGTLDDPWTEAPESIYQLTKSPLDAPDEPAIVDVEFERGVPAKLNGVALGLVELIQSLETIAGVHGVGRIDMVENRTAGAKSREIYEAPAAVVLHAAHRELQAFVTPRDLERLTSELGVQYADLVYKGQWYTATRQAIDALVRHVQERVTGVIRVRLFKGECRVIGRQSPFADVRAANAGVGVPSRK
ncbi:MAG TPA: argininosuccinate synthase [Vicinamibacterales bacterium]|nr:argininosuccinate synthase [Vicinamibacterales bacterium]